jgi:hypothetical protein
LPARIHKVNCFRAGKPRPYSKMIVNAYLGTVLFILIETVLP